MSAPEESGEESLFRLHLDHAKAGYANAQETIRFIDTKTGVLTGVLLVTTGLPFIFLNFLCSGEGTSAKSYLFEHRWGAKLLCILMLLGIVFGVLSLMSSTNGLMARIPMKGSTSERGILVELLNFVLCKLCIRKRAGIDFPLTVLFPLYPPERASEASQQFEKLGNGEIDEKRVLWDYRLQLETSGKILYTKLERNRDAIRWFELQVLTYCAALATVLVVALFAEYQPSTPPIPVTSQTKDA